MQQVVRIFSLADEWGSSRGGLSTLNREMCKWLAQVPDVLVTLVVLKFTEAEKEEALKHKVNLVKVEEIPGFDPISSLSFLPRTYEIDAVVGHGEKLGPPAFAMAREQFCKRIHVVHKISEEIAMFKREQIPAGHKKHEIEIKLSQAADVIVSIGPKLTDYIQKSLQPYKKAEDVINFTPGIFTEFSKLEPGKRQGKQFSILLVGDGDEEDFKVKGYDVAARAIAALEGDCKLMFVGAENGKEQEVANRFLHYGIPENKLILRTSYGNRHELANLFLEVDLAIMPSRTEGFGLGALEALSAGLPILVNSNSGLGEVLTDLPTGDSFVVQSNDLNKWKEAIGKVMRKSRDMRLREAITLRTHYHEEYKWQEPCKAIVAKLRQVIFPL